MDVTALIIGTILAIIAFIVGEKFYRFYLFRQRVNKIPGPTFAIPFIGMAYEIIKLPKEERLDWFEKLAHRYKGGIFRTWLAGTPIIEIRKPEYVEVILRSNAQITKSEGYDPLLPWLGRGLLTSTGPQWFHSRKLITPSFHFGVLEEFAEVMIEQANILNNCIERETKLRGEKPIEMFELTVRCALDIICETAMGVKINAQEKVGNEYMEAVSTISSIAVTRFFRPWLMWDWIFYRTDSGRAFKAAVKTSHTFCTRVIEQKQKERRSRYAENDRSNGEKNDEPGDRKKKAFLDLLLEANETEENPLTIEELRDQANTFMFAGHDTTGALIAWTLFCLGNAMDVQRKVHEELDEVLGDADDSTTLKRLSNLKYLERVIKEALRLYPSAPAISRHLTEDLIMGDYILPKGAILSVEIYIMHRDAAVWPDPLSFDPDRFLPEKIRSRHPYAYVPFSAGPRNCIGQKYAMLEAKVVLTQVLRKFSIKSVDDHSTVKKYGEIILRPVDGIFVHMKKR